MEKPMMGYCVGPERWARPIVFRLKQSVFCNITRCWQIFARHYNVEILRVRIYETRTDNRLA